MTYLTSLPAETVRALATMLGEQVVSWVTVVQVRGGLVYGLYPPGQSPAITADLVDDLAEILGTPHGALGRAVS